MDKNNKKNMAGTGGFVKYWLEMTATSHRKLLWWFYVLQNDWNRANKKERKREEKTSLIYILTTQLAFTVLGQKYHAFQSYKHYLVLSHHNVLPLFISLVCSNLKKMTTYKVKPLFSYLN